MIKYSQDLIKLVKAFVKPAKTILITGDRGAGKTDISMLFSEILINEVQGWQIITNIYLEQKYDNITHISNAVEMFLFLAKSDKKCFVVLDEAGLIASGKKSMSSANINLEMFIDLIRKFRVCLAFITPDQKNVAPKIRNNYDLWIHKNTKKTGYARLNNERSRPLFLKDIPATSIRFDTFNLAGFYFNVDMQTFGLELSKFHSQEYKNKVIEILEKKNKNDNEISNRLFCIECLKRAHNAGVESPPLALWRSGFSPYSLKHLYHLYNTVILGEK